MGINFQINTFKLGGPKQADSSGQDDTDGDVVSLTRGRNTRLNTVRILEYRGSKVGWNTELVTWVLVNVRMGGGGKWRTVRSNEKLCY
jgi:hypothetical protein